MTFRLEVWADNWFAAYLGTDLLVEERRPPRRPHRGAHPSRSGAPPAFDPLAVDANRVARPRAEGYDVLTQTVPEEITPGNGLILGVPKARS